jgi:hypothetical protein
LETGVSHSSLCLLVSGSYSLIFSLSAIIRIVKRRSWRMKALTWSMFALVLREARRTDRGSSSTVSRPFTKFLCHGNILSRDRVSLPNAFWIFSWVSPPVWHTKKKLN